MEGDTLPISLPLKRAVALQNFLEAELTVGKERIASNKAEFIVSPCRTVGRLPGHGVLPLSARTAAGLRDLGITAGQIQNIASRKPDGAGICGKTTSGSAADRMAYDFYAPCHTPALKDKGRHEGSRSLYRPTGGKRRRLRQPCFDDHDAEARALARIKKCHSSKTLPPFLLFTDETEVANLVERAWDFCFCPLTLTAMREWLVEQYGWLQRESNREWGTHYPSLEAVVPLSTDK